MKSARQKGNKAEREVAAFLQAWWRVLEPEAVFFRTPGSGAWASTHQTTGMKSRGDIMVNPETCKFFNFSVEVKHRAVITPAAIRHFEEGVKSPINAYWKQCVDNAAKDGLNPMLVFRGNRQPWRAAVLRSDGERWVTSLDSLCGCSPLAVMSWSKQLEEVLT